MIDNLTEAIAHAREVAKEQRTQAELSEYTDLNYRASACLECAEEHEQLAAWLEELKERRDDDYISFEGMTVSEALHDLENCVLPVVCGKSIRIAIRALKVICDRRKRYKIEDK